EDEDERETRSQHQLRQQVLQHFLRCAAGPGEDWCNLGLCLRHGQFPKCDRNTVLFPPFHRLVSTVVDRLAVTSVALPAAGRGKERGAAPLPPPPKRLALGCGPGVSE